MYKCVIPMAGGGGNATIEAVCSSLVREYLSSKGLTETLKRMDEESPRTQLSINSRHQLMKQVQLERLMNSNKEEATPLKAMLEVMTKHFVQRSSCPSLDQVNQQESHTFGQLNDLGVSYLGKESKGRATAKLYPAARLEQGDQKNRQSDLILDDVVDSVTHGGKGRAGVISPEVLDLGQAQNNIWSAVSLSGRKSSAHHNGQTVTQNHKKEPHIHQSSADHQPQQRHQPLKERCPRREEEFFQLGEKSTTNISHTLPASTDSHSSKSHLEGSPSTFEALLLKGQNKANSLQKTSMRHLEVNINGSPELNVGHTRELKGSYSQAEGTDHRGQVYTSPHHLQDCPVSEFEDLELNSGIGGCGSVKLHKQPSKLQRSKSVTSVPVDLKTAITLKNTVLGSPNMKYNEEWLLQGYTFCEHPNLKYGFVQKQGGPCGVLAAIQACLLQEMLFGDNKVGDPRFKNPSRTESSRALARALCHMLWKIGNSSQAVVALSSMTTHVPASTKFTPDGVTEKLEMFTFKNFDELSNFITESISHFGGEHSPGVILTVYSALLTRKAHNVRADFDDPGTTLIGSYGYCTQELVNLLLTGRAVSNTFNGVVELDSGKLGQTISLKGIMARSDVGYLSLFEHYKSCQVGTFYKTPKNPIWVVCSESHYSVIFSTQKDLIQDWKAERKFDLIYYDGLAGQQQEIKLTISTLNHLYKADVSDDALVPPLEHCIRTKWPDAEIDWNGSEPIL